MSEVKLRFKVCRKWFCYEISDSILSDYDEKKHGLYNFVSLFENFTENYELDVVPFAIHHIYCATFIIGPNSQKRNEKRTNTKKNTKKRTKNNEPKLLGPKRILICIDPVSEILYCDQQLSNWLLKSFKRCLQMPPELEINLIATVTATPQSFSRIKIQQGTETGSQIESSYAAMQHDYLTALQQRGLARPGDAALGKVTKTIGARPESFPIVSETTVVFKGVSPSVNLTYHPDMPEEQLQKYLSQVQNVKLSSVTVTILSPSLLHLYYNRSFEVYRKRCLSALTYCSEKDITGSLKRKNALPMQRSPKIARTFVSSNVSEKQNLEGLIYETPPFLQRLRSKSSIHQIVEMK